MDLQTALITLLHILVFVYWVGGDLGAFMSSYTLIDGKKDLKVRLYTLKLIDNVDMAPRSCLILAAPTGLLLASTKGWMQIETGYLVAVWAFALAWLSIVWGIHFAGTQEKKDQLKKIDYSVRAVIMFALLGSGAYVIWVASEVPLFIGIKLMLLGLILFCGVIVRQVFGPLTLAIRDTIANGQSEENDRIIRHTILRRSKPVVSFIWVLATIAAVVGIMQPV